MRYRDSILAVLERDGRKLSEEEFTELLPIINVCDDVMVAYIAYVDKHHKYRDEGHIYVGVESKEDLRLYDADLIDKQFWLVDPVLIAEHRIWSS